jgi:hypothetical protein
MTDDLPEGWEEWLAFFTASLPQPVGQQTAPDGSVTFHAGDPGEVIVHLAPAVITVSLFTIQWTGRGEPLIVARPVGYTRWRRLPSEHATRIVEAMIAGARAARLATFRSCRACERTMPPELMHDEELCESCAARDKGQVH